MHFNTLLLNYDVTEQYFQDFNITSLNKCAGKTIWKYKTTKSATFAQNYCESYIYTMYIIHVHFEISTSLWKYQ